MSIQKEQYQVQNMNMNFPRKESTTSFGFHRSPVVKIHCTDQMSSNDPPVLTNIPNVRSTPVRQASNRKIEENKESDDSLSLDSNDMELSDSDKDIAEIKQIVEPKTLGQLQADRRGFGVEYNRGTIPLNIGGSKLGKVKRQQAGGSDMYLSKNGTWKRRRTSILNKLFGFFKIFSSVGFNSAEMLYFFLNI